MTGTDGQDEAAQELRALVQAFPPSPMREEDETLWDALSDEFPDPWETLSEFPVKGSEEHARLDEQASKAWNARISTLIERAYEDDDAAYGFIWRAIIHYTVG